MSDTQQVTFNLTDTQIEAIKVGLIAFVNVLNNVSLKRAEAAGQAGADSITTIEQANAFLKALAGKEKK